MKLSLYIFSLKLLQFEYTSIYKPKTHFSYSPFVRKVQFLDRYFFPIHSGDRDIVMNTQRLRYLNEKKRPIQFENYIGFRWVTRAYFLLTFYDCMCLLLQLPMDHHFHTNYSIIHRYNGANSRFTSNFNKKSEILHQRTFITRRTCRGKSSYTTLSNDIPHQRMDRTSAIDWGAETRAFNATHKPRSVLWHDMFVGFSYSENNTQGAW